MEKLVTPISEPSTSWSSGLYQKLVFTVLERITGVGLTIHDPQLPGDGNRFFGESDAEIQAQLNIHDQGVYKSLVSGGSIAAAEAFINNQWSSPNLTRLIEAFVICQQQLDELESNMSWLTKLKNKLFHRRNKNSQTGSKENILAHYDLGNDLYTRFLDPEMMYSSAIYSNGATDLDAAQLNKLNLICQRLELTDKDHLVEIGTGWGGLAIYAAQHYGCKVTTTTISDAQHDYAEQRIKALGLQDKITLLKRDYRELTGQYDKLVSIEMIEAVGFEFYTEFFSKCNALLKPGGKMLIQAITIADQRFDHYRTNVDFIQRYIFPGGCLPSIEFMTKHLRQDTDMVLHELHDIGLDYAQTLNEWRVRFNKNWQDLTEFGFDERFRRLWNYYLSYCEGAFLQRATSTVHFVARK
ncbi:SAM-dependent methyltransferase [Psychrosphaera aestuarii]|uniref:SAM-dependent methyltransferase n=1 Tax=Psychrosphaera aestuarii TaxID=1266052 RepID=UPI001B3428A6|nr:cyclopropane-fatty-acyl-phospholipid synthase family protein [Psychrosphaera aestuarii]